MVLLFFICLFILVCILEATVSDREYSERQKERRRFAAQEVIEYIDDDDEYDEDDLAYCDSSFIDGYEL